MDSLDSVLLSYQTAHQPIRSVSLPSRIYPLSFKLKAALHRLSIWQRSSTLISVSSSFGSNSLLIGLVNLTELYCCIHELLESPYVKHTLLHYQKGKLLEDSLDGSILLLDVCEATKAVITAMREHVANLKSAFRRKGNVEKEVKAYVNLRKKAKKVISKHITTLKKMDIKDTSTNISQDLAIASTSVLIETIEITVSIFRHLLLFLSTIPPLLPPYPAIKIKNSIGFLSFPLRSLLLSDKSMDLVKEMKSFDSFGDLEIELDSVFKCLVKTRVLFLNILSNC
ncbi:unnamed protein product [Cochlearia groenlandica]